MLLIRQNTIAEGIAEGIVERVAARTARDRMAAFVAERDAVAIAERAAAADSAATTSWTIAAVRAAVERAAPVYTNTGGGWSIAPAEEPIPPGEVAAILLDAYGDSRVSVAQLSAINWYEGDRDFRSSAAAPHPLTGEGGDRIAEKLVAALS